MDFNTLLLEQPGKALLLAFILLTALGEGTIAGRYLIKNRLFLRKKIRNLVALNAIAVFYYIALAAIIHHNFITIDMTYTVFMQCFFFYIGFLGTIEEEE